MTRRTNQDRALRKRGDYDQYFDHLKVESSFLQPKHPNRTIDQEAMQLNDAASVRTLIADYERRDGKHPGRIQRAEAAIQEIAERHERQKRERVVFGADELKGMAADNLAEHDRALAYYDVRLEERDWLRGRLAKFEEREDASRRTFMRQEIGKNTGGGGRDREGRLRRSWDGQWLSTYDPRTGAITPLAGWNAPDGVFLIIDDPLSPYSGMALRDFRLHISDPIMRERGATIRKPPADRVLPDWPEGVPDWKAPKRRRKADDPADEAEAEAETAGGGAA